MPCYETTTCNCTLQNADLDLLKKALENRGYSCYRVGNKGLSFSGNGHSGTYQNNQLNFTYSGVKPDTDAIKREYSKAVVARKVQEYEADGWESEVDGEDVIIRRPSAGYGSVYA